MKLDFLKLVGLEIRQRLAGGWLAMRLPFLLLVFVLAYAPPATADSVKTYRSPTIVVYVGSG